MERFGDIIERVERVRANLGLTKHGFATTMGISPQTYNNFTGCQGSKPSVELLYGVVRYYGVNPQWLLTGCGEMLLPGLPVGPVGDGAASLDHTFDLAASQSAESRLTNGRSGTGSMLGTYDYSLGRLRVGQCELLDRITSAMERFIQLIPVDAENEIRALLERMENRISEP